MLKPSWKQRDQNTERFGDKHVLLGLAFPRGGANPHLGPARYIYACYLEIQNGSGSSSSEFDLESVWSCQRDLLQETPVKVSPTL